MVLKNESETKLFKPSDSESIYSSQLHQVTLLYDKKDVQNKNLPHFDKHFSNGPENWHVHTKGGNSTLGSYHQTAYLLDPEHLAPEITKVATQGTQ